MKILVTGATGFVGSNLVKRLLKEGHDVAALVRESSDYSEIKRNGVDTFFGDITKEDSVREAASGVDIIFNCAAALPYHKLPDKDYSEVNVKGVENVLRACSSKKVKRLVHISTVGIYGKTDKKAINEESLPKPSDIYSKTKNEGEKLVWMEIKKKRLDATIIRPTIGYGPGDTRPGFPDLFKLIKMGVFVPVGKGENFFHTIYIDNLIDALLLAAYKKEAINQDFIIGDEPCPRMKDIISVISEVTKSLPLPIRLPTPAALLVAKLFDPLKQIGFPATLTTRRIRFITEDKIFSTEKARRLLGYKAKIKLQEGIKMTYDWYREKRYLS